jgi:hypothetical protein
LVSRRTAGRARLLKLGVFQYFEKSYLQVQVWFA